MKKVELLKDMKIIGCPTIKAGTQFKLENYNTRYVYVQYLGCSLRLSLKDVKVVY